MPLLTVYNGDQVTELDVPQGANLRRTLLDAGISPYTALTQHLNCGGRGLCATCGMWIEANEPAPQHWHDRIGASFGYPRLSCQIAIEEDMTIRMVQEKRIWGGPDKARRWHNNT
jgi:ferredoxin